MSKIIQEWLNDQIGVKRKKSMPVLSFPSTSLMGISVTELIGKSELQAKGLKMIADRLDTSASVSMMDLSVEAEAFGSTVRFFDDEVPTVIGALVKSQEDADALKVPEVGAFRTGCYIDGISKACGLITDRPVFAGIIGPFSLAGRLVDVTTAMMMCIENPEIMHTVLKKTVQFLIKYSQAYKDAGANGIVMAEPLTGLLSPGLAKKFSEPYVKEIIDAVKDDDFAVIYHNCGASVVKMTDSLLRLNASAYHFGNSISMKKMMELLPPDVIAMGNIDPASQFRNGTPESIREDTLRVLDECWQFPNFVISSGCDIPAQSSWDNIDAFFNAVDEFYTNKNM